MKTQFTKKGFTAALMLASLFAVQQTNAQNILWEEDFGGGIPSGWTNVNVGGTGGTAADLWQWVTTMDAAVNLYGAPDFQAPTMSNGHMLYDSDAIGSLAQNHDGRLTTTAIDFSNDPEVWVTFHSQYREYTDFSEPFVGVSTDNVNFTYFPIYEWILDNTQTDPDYLVEVNISSVAANQSQVYVQFRWVGNYEYHMRIDDIAMTDGIPPHNMSVPVGVISPNAMIPLVQADTLTFGGTVRNVGGATQTNVMLTANVEYAGASVFSEMSSTIGFLDPGMDSTIAFAGMYVPDAVGTYTISYTVSQDSTDSNLDNNTYSYSFDVTPNVFSKEPGSNGVVSPAANDPIWEFGNYYFVKSGASRADSVSFGVASNDPLEGVTVSLWLRQITEDADPNAFTDDDLTIVGFASYTFSATDANFDIITVGLEDFLTGDAGVPLVENAEYIVSVEFPSTDVFCATNNTMDYPGEWVVSVVKADLTWYLGGFSGGQVAQVRILTDNIVGLEDIADSKINPRNVIVYPSVTSDQINYLVDGNEVLQISVFDVNGVLLNESKTSGLKGSVDVSSFASGTYFLSVKTDLGTITKTFFVNR
jgi:hypothetical protein